MKIRKRLALIIILLSLAACQPTVAPIMSAPTMSAPTMLVREESPQPVTPSPTVKKVDTPAPSLTNPPTIPAETSSPSPTKEALQLFSPLAEHELDELPELISSPYDPPPPGDDARHHGIDFCYFAGDEREFIAGEGVQAIFSGTVAAAIEDRLPYGNMVMIETRYEALSDKYVLALGMQPGESLYHLYAHFQNPPEVALGEWVPGGSVLGQVGKTGYNIVTEHLHLETRIGPAGAIFENMAYYDVSANEDEMEAYEQWRISGVFRHVDPAEVLFGVEDSEQGNRIGNQTRSFFCSRWVDSPIGHGIQGSWCSPSSGETTNFSLLNAICNRPGIVSKIGCD